MKRITLLTLTLTVSLISSAQKDVPDFGSVPPEDLAMTACPLDSEAEALVLLKTGETNFNLGNGDNEMVTNYRFRIKILKDKGLFRANVIIPYYAHDDIEVIEDVQGVTFNPEGATSLEKANIYRKSLEKNIDEVVFSLPNVRKGSVIEYKFTKISRHFASIEPWNFQEDIPVRFSRYYIDVPPYIDFTYTVHCSLPIDVESKNAFNDGIKVFTMKDVPALKEEPFMTARRDYLQRVDFQLSSTNFPGQGTRVFHADWGKNADELLANDYFGGQLEKIPHTDSLDARLAGVTDPVARMAAVYEYVRRNMTWTNVHTMYSEGARDAWTRKSGNTADINFVLIDLLRKAGLDACPVLVSRRAHGRVNPANPLLSQFDEVLAYVRIGSQVFVLNGADRFTPYTLIPLDVSGSNAFLVESRGRSEWVTLGDPDPRFAITVSLNGDIGANGRLTAAADIVNAGYAKTPRLRILSEGQDRFREVYFTREYSKLRVDSLAISGQDNDSLPLEQHLDFHMALEHSGDYWFFSPNLFLGLNRNPFTRPTRFSDIDFGYLQSYTVVGSVALPEGFGVEALPKNMRMIMPDTSILLERILQLDEDRLGFRIRVEFKRPRYYVDEYDAFREFYKRLFDALNEPVVIRKKSNP
jgi:hypothetical protein